MKSDDPAVVIIGGGYSGTMVAAELARRGIASTVVDGSRREGRGTAYSTSERGHLLNVVAAKMGAWADRPDDFAKDVAGEYQPDAYVPRRRYGQYLTRILEDAGVGGLVDLVSSDAHAAEKVEDGWSVTMADGSRLRGKALVLAQGNQPPLVPPLARGLPPGLFVNDPWSDAGRGAIVQAAASGGEVLLIGTGLTMVDVVLSLDEARLRGRILAVSRRGLLPRSHAPHDPSPVTLDELPLGSLQRLWSWLTDRSASVGWRAAVDSLRPHSHAIWQSLSEPEQRRFLRHARPWWDVHRHRIAPEVAERIERLIKVGQLEIAAGRVTDMWPEGAQLGVTLRKRGPVRIASDHGGASSSSVEERRFALAVNCTGPLGSIVASGDPLITSLFTQGLARPDALCLGIEVDARSRIAGASRAWAVGPMTKGKFWEITAVPDIRGQVAQVAEDIAKELQP